MKASTSKRMVAWVRLYWLASLFYEAYRLVFKPHTHGSLVAIWYMHQLLLVQTSYRSGWGLPGGGVQAHESALQAALRELDEELGLVLPAEQLLNPWMITEGGVRGLNTVSIFTAELTERPEVRIDGMEIVAFGWYDLEQAKAIRLPSHVRAYLEAFTSQSTLRSTD